MAHMASNKSSTWFQDVCCDVQSLHMNEPVKLGKIKMSLTASNSWACMYSSISWRPVTDIAIVVNPL